jgi:anti-sigma regulatory factor (Ser/Thr protein kinase)
MMQIGAVQGTDARGGASRRIEWAVPFAASSVPVVRTEVTLVLRSANIAPAVIETARTVVSELLTNAMVHASPLPAGELEVVLTIEPDILSLSVADGGSVTLPQVMHPPPLSPNGRGLDIVRALTREWGVREGTDGSNTVFAVIGI